MRGRAEAGICAVLSQRRPQAPVDWRGGLADGGVNGDPLRLPGLCSLAGSTCRRGSVFRRELLLLLTQQRVQGRRPGHQVQVEQRVRPCRHMCRETCRTVVPREGAMDCGSFAVVLPSVPRFQGQAHSSIWSGTHPQGASCGPVFPGPASSGRELVSGVTA